MIIRDAQMEALSQMALEQYIDKEVVYFRALYGDDLEKSDDDLRKSFKDWIGHAKEYGIVNEVQVERYLKLCLTEDDMLEDPKSQQINNILAWEGDPEEVKLDNLEQYFNEK